MKGIQELLDQSIGAEPFKIGDRERVAGIQGIDLLKIKFEALIEAYNSGSRNIEEIFKDLIALAGVLTRKLLERLNALLVLGWRQKIQSRAKIRLAIEDTLDEGLPRAYTKDLFAKKSDVLFEHVYEAYSGDGRSVFTPSA